MSDLFGNHIVGFPTRWLILAISLESRVGTDVPGEASVA